MGAPVTDIEFEPEPGRVVKCTAHEPLDGSALHLRGSMKADENRPATLSWNPPRCRGARRAGAAPDSSVRIDSSATSRVPRFREAWELDTGVRFVGGSSTELLTRNERVYHEQRNHQGLRNKLLEPTNDNSAANGRVVRRKRLGGLLSYYQWEAA